MSQRSDKIIDVCIAVFGYAVIVPLGFLALMWMFGTMMDGIADYSQQHDACLKHATNGYEIRGCH